MEVDECSSEAPYVVFKASSILTLLKESGSVHRTMQVVKTYSMIYREVTVQQSGLTGFDM